MKARHEILFNQLESYRMEVLQLLEDVTQEEAEIIPKGFRNNIRWNAGHIYLDQFLWIEALTNEPSKIPSNFSTSFGFGTSPSDFTNETPSLSELISLLKEQPTLLKNLYGHRLEEEFPPIDMGMCTIEQVLIRTIFHEGIHLQAIVNIKNCMKA